MSRSATAANDSLPRNAAFGVAALSRSADRPGRRVNGSRPRAPVRPAGPRRAWYDSTGPDRSGTERARPEAQGSVREAIERAMAEEGLSERAALKAVARSLGISKSEAYRQWQFEKGLQK